MTMASIRLRNGKYQVQIRKRPYPLQSKTFLTRPDAIAWAKMIEIQLDKRGTASEIDPDLLLADLITRYRNEITPLKKGKEQETRRLNRLVSDPVCSKKSLGFKSI